MAPLAKEITTFDGPEYYIGKGLSETVMDRLDEALEIFLQGFRNYPENLEIQFFLIRTTGDIACSRNNPDLLKEIIAMWDQFITSHPNEKFSVSRGTAHAFVERGRLKQVLGDVDGAHEDFTRARVIDPDILIPAPA